MRFSLAILLVLTFSTAANADWWSNRWHDVTKGPGANNWLVDGPIQKNEAAISHGLDDVMHGKAPGPAILGTVGHTRVCFPWC